MRAPATCHGHLQTLAKYGFIEEAEGAKGRSRPWKINASSNRFSAREDDPASMAAGQQLATLLIERSYERLREWWAHQQSFSKQWRDAAYINDSMNFMTAAELATLSEQITELLMQFNDRLDPARRPEGALPVHFTAYSHPLPPTDVARLTGAVGLLSPTLSKRRPPRPPPAPQPETALGARPARPRPPARAGAHRSPG